DGRAVYMTTAEKQMCLAQSRQFWAGIDEGTLERLSLGLDASEQEEEEEDEAVMEMSGASAYEGVEGGDPNVPLTPPGLAFDFGPKDEKPRLSNEEARRRLMNQLEVLAKG